MDAVLVAVALLAHGVAAGVMFSTVIGLAPLAIALPYDGYVRTIQFLWKRYDPFMPIANSVTIAIDLLLVLTADRGPARALFGAAGLLLAVVMAISVIKNVPINRYVMSLDPQSPPADWAARDPRVTWKNWNLLRTSLALVALGANLAGAAALM